MSPGAAGLVTPAEIVQQPLAAPPAATPAATATRFAYVLGRSFVAAVLGLGCTYPPAPHACLLLFLGMRYRESLQPI